mmetsp:Transcript_23316/g.55278  ORF Transcript_23316/g.55278 Transcript_23316/m.55278 type:complete len:108 (-) Transcript_23316:50-373(-)
MAKYIQKSKNEMKKTHATMYGSAQTLPPVVSVFVRVVRDVVDDVASSGVAEEVAVIEFVSAIAGGGDAAAPGGHDDSSLAWFVAVCGDGMFNAYQCKSMKGIECQEQ